MSLGDPQLVRAEYADESRLLIRRSIWDSTTGPDARDIAIAAVAEASPRSVLEVGCGTGELAARIAAETGAELVALDQSERMVELTRARGVRAVLGDVCELPFAAESFDCAVAAWMLYHARDVGRAVDELARVLRPGGRLVAATHSMGNMAELWELLGEGPRTHHPFSAENGEQILRRRFSRVERREARGRVTFADADAIRRYVGASVTRSHLADRVPELDGPLSVTRTVVVFVAEPAP